MVKKLDTWGGVKFRSEANGMFGFFGGQDVCFLANIAKVKRSRRLFLFECLKCIPFFLLLTQLLSPLHFDDIS